MSSIEEQWMKMKANWHQWSHPLRPNPREVQQLIYATYADTNYGDDPRVLLLGETVELMQMATHCIDIVPTNSQTKRGNWLDMSCYEDGMFDVVLGDGCLNVVGHEVDALFKEVKRILKPGGRFVQRVFVRPSPLMIGLNELLAGKDKVENYSSFKLQVMCAMGEFVPVEEVNRLLTTDEPNPQVEAYQGSGAIYYFPTAAQLRALKPKGASKPKLFYSANAIANVGYLLPVVTWVFE